MYDDDNFDDGFDERTLTQGIRLHLWRRLFRYALPYKRELAMLAGFAVITASVEVSLPLITRALIDAVVAQGSDTPIWRYGLLYLLCVLTLALSVGSFIWAGGKLRTHMSHDIRRDGFANLQRLSFSFYDYRPVGWLMARMTSDCERLTNILVWGLLDMVWGSVLMLGIALAMFIMNAKLAALAFSVLPLLAWISLKFQRRILTSAREVRRTNSRITATYNEAIMGVLTSKAFVREQANQRDFGELTARMNRASVRNAVQAAIYVPLVITLASLAMGLTLAVGGGELLAGAISAGTLVAFMTYARHFFEPVEQMGRWFAEMQMAQASAERVMSLVHAQPDIRDAPAVQARLANHAGSNQVAGADAATQMDAALAADGGASDIQQVELRDLSFAYGNGPPVLTDINLVARKGDVIAIVGPTGGGKSTLVNLICRFYEPSAGAVLIDGVDYRQRSLHWLQSNLGIVLQSAHIFSGSVRENIRYGRLEATDAEVEQAARMAGADFIWQLPAGFATQVGEGGSRLSAGQKQLLSFARAILADPAILVMDEATSSVDTETEQRIQQGLTQVLKGRISFVIAHRLSTIRNASRIVLIRDGRIAELGTHQELMAQRGYYFDLYRQQSLQETTAQTDWQDQPAR